MMYAVLSQMRDAPVAVWQETMCLDTHGRRLFQTFQEVSRRPCPGPTCHLCFVTACSAKQVPDLAASMPSPGADWSVAWVAISA